ncbi:hypothetical protein M378DRAFT_17109 [Amanita muscaria Koide BX008]|uniref:Uncharacterized protein n=1 Tax=Amanita muscaria (strain Koide BX008) TaxID=946122 RepID=A0A0C2WJR0_AMAMK|nr:hypothetical protein M378DRAFT_17109 [Amanita muscaria Koide BX008]
MVDTSSKSIETSVAEVQSRTASENRNRHSLTSYHHLPLSDMAQKPVVRASSSSYGRYSDLTVDPMDATTSCSSSVAPSVFYPVTFLPVHSSVPTSATVVLSPETPLSYTFQCITAVYNKKASDDHRAQALYQVFIEIASELETTSQFKAVMICIAENLGQLEVFTIPPLYHKESLWNPCGLPGVYRE